MWRKDLEILELQEQTGATARDLANVAGCSPATIYQAVNGFRSFPMGARLKIFQYLRQCAIDRPALPVEGAPHD